MQRYFWNIDQRAKSNLLYRATLGCGENSLSGAIFDEEGDSSRLIPKHRNGDRKRLSVWLASKLLRNSEPSYDLEESETYIVDSYERGDTEYIVLDEDFKNYLLSPYGNQELSDLTGKSPMTCKEYRFEEGKSIPRPSYEEIFYNTREILSGPLRISGEIEKPEVPGSSEVLIDEAYSSDVIIFDWLERFRDGRENIEIFRSLLKDIEDTMSDPLKGHYIKPSDSMEGRYFNVLEDAGILEPWKESSNVPTYEIKAEGNYLNLLIQELET